MGWNGLEMFKGSALFRLYIGVVDLRANGPMGRQIMIPFGV